VAARIHPGVLLSLIMCVLLTVAFTFLVLAKSNAIKMQREGDPERPQYKTIIALEKDWKSERDRLATAKSELENRLTELDQVELESNRRGIAYTANSVTRFGAAPEAAPVETRGLIMLPRIKGAADSKMSVEGRDLSLPDGSAAYAAVRVNGVEQMLAAHKTAAEARAATGWPEMNAVIEKHGQQLSEVLQRRAALDAAFSADVTKLESQLKQKGDERTAAERIHRDDVNRRQNKILQLDDRIRELLELDLKFMAEIDPVGTIISADTDLRQVVIDLGRGERVVPGLLFEVFNYDRGRYLEKGMAEVIEVGPRTAVCRVLSVIDHKRQPVAKGDRIGNPVFNPSHPKVFVLAPPPAEFSRFNREDLADFIRRTGGIVRDELGPGCDYLVVRGDDKDRSDNARARARQYHILAMTEAQLLKYVQKTFSPRTGALADAK
jgi:hypothetical protein